MNANPSQGLDPDFEGRVLVVANRLPLSIKANEDGEYEYSISSGGLVSGLKGLSKIVDFKWFGWPGIDVHRNDKDTVRKQLAEKFNAVPIFLNDRLARAHYNGFCSTPSFLSTDCVPELIARVQILSFGRSCIGCLTAQAQTKAGRTRTRKSTRSLPTTSCHMWKTTT
jgi:hypothetical protein